MHIGLIGFFYKHFYFSCSSNFCGSLLVDKLNSEFVCIEGSAHARRACALLLGLPVRSSTRPNTLRTNRRSLLRFLLAGTRLELSGGWIGSFTEFKFSRVIGLLQSRGRSRGRGFAQVFLMVQVQAFPELAVTLETERRLSDSR